MGKRHTDDRTSRDAKRAAKAASRAEGTAGAPSPLTLAALLGFAAVALLNLVLWFDLLGVISRQPGEAEMQRRAALLLLVSPDRMFEMWCGNRIGSFALLDRAPIMLAAAAILFGAWSAGRCLLEGLSVAHLVNRLEQAVLATAAGLNLLSLYTLLIGLSGGLQVRWLFAVPLAVLIAYGAAQLWFDWRQATPVPASGPHNPSDRRWLGWLVAIVPFAGVMLLGAILPPSDYDVREYHLQVPKEWFQQGRITFLPHNVYGNMPLGSELTALWGMALMGGDDAWWWGALVGKTVMACYSLVSIAGLIALGSRVHSLGAGMLAAVVYASTPWIAQVSLAGYNEGPTGLYFLTGLFALWLAWSAEHTTQTLRFTLLAGFLAGAGVACKYPSALFLVVPLTIWVALQPFIRISTLQQTEQGARSAIAVGFFLIGVTIACGPWLAKNWALSGNPTYPLLVSVFGGETRTPEKDQQWRRVHSPQPDEQGQRFTLAQLREQTAWNLWRTRGASVILLPLVLAAWMAKPQRGLVALLSLWLLFVLVCWWLLTHRLDRFLAPLLPVVALLAGIGALALPDLSWRRATMGLILLGAVVQFPIASLLVGDHRYFVPLDALQRDDPQFAEVLDLRIGIPHRWLNAHVPAGKRVLLVGDAEPFDLTMLATYNTCFDDCQFARLFQGKSRAERLAALQAEGITHVFFSWAHLDRYRSRGNYGYTSDYVTRDLVHLELVAEQGLLRPVIIDNPVELGLPPEARLAPELGEIFEVAPR